MTFEEWWTQRETVAGCALNGADNASAAWGYQQERIETKNSMIMTLEDSLKESQQKHLDSIRALRRANEQITRIAADNVQLRKELANYEEPEGDEYVTNEVKCNRHPDAPHGYNRNASHAEGRYVCDCEYWEPDESEDELVSGCEMYAAIHNVEDDAFYVGTLAEIMEWMEDHCHGVSNINFYRLGDEVRIGFVDMGKETRFRGK